MDSPSKDRRKMAVAMPAVLFTVYARTVMGRQIQGSPMGSFAPSGDPSGQRQSLDELLKKPHGEEQIYP